MGDAGEGGSMFLYTSNLPLGRVSECKRVGKGSQAASFIDTNPKADNARRGNRCVIAWLGSTDGVDQEHEYLSRVCLRHLLMKSSKPNTICVVRYAHWGSLKSGLGSDML